MAKVTESGEQISVRFPSELRAELQRLAEQDDRTLSSLVRRIVVRALRQGEGQVAA